VVNLDKQDRSRQASVWVDGDEYPIHTEFWYWVSFCKKFERMQREGVKEFSLDELDYLYKAPEYIKPRKKSVFERLKSLFKKPAEAKPGRSHIPGNRAAGYQELQKFYLNEQPLPRPGKQSKVRGMDWLIDSEYIYAAFMQQYGIDLIAADLHWHSFLALFNGLMETRLNEIMSTRYYIRPVKGAKDPMEEVYREKEELREAWKLETLEEFKPEPFKMR